ncbi:MAG: hypothetical protein KME06_06630 [Kastovskya adunca ATA6-11-RM4]|jgi:hypothetical protein|nr:hypothetical protein [Kastovskya adunca ATA6-11-RM4]
MTSGQSSNSNAVEVDGIEFETVLPEQVLSVPKKNVVQKLLYVLQCLSPTLPQHPSPSVSVQIGLRITNNTSIPYNFRFFQTWIPELVGAKGQIEFDASWFRPGFLRDSDFLFIMPGESKVFFPDSQIYEIWGNQFSLNMAIDSERTLTFKPLRLGIYQFRFIYSNQDPEVTVYDYVTEQEKLIKGLWLGVFTTPFVEFYIIKS